MDPSVSKNIITSKCGYKMNINNNHQYISTVLQGYIQEGSNGEISNWLKSNVDQRANIDQFAKMIFEKYPNLNAHHKSQKRYRFCPTNHKEWFLQALFDESFKRHPEKIIASANEMTSTNVSSYPKWKSVVLIEAPKNIAKVVQSDLFKVAFVIGALAASFFACTTAYGAITNSVATNLPFIINNTPIEVIRAGNALLDGVAWVGKRKFQILIGMYLSREAILHLPNIPYVTRVARAIDLWPIVQILFNSPQTIFFFAIDTAINTANFCSSIPANVGNFIKGIGLKEESQRLLVSKKRCNELWKQAAPDLANFQLSQ